MIKSSFLIIVTLLLSCPMYGQGVQRQVSRKIPVTIQPFPFDTLSPMPGSLQCFNEAKSVPSTCFHVNYITKSIHFDTLVADSVTITYYRFNVDFTPRYQLLDSSILTRNQLIQRFTDKKTIQESALFGESNELQKKGRGLSPALAAGDAYMALTEATSASRPNLTCQSVTRLKAYEQSGSAKVRG